MSQQIAEQDAVGDAAAGTKPFIIDADKSENSDTKEIVEDGIPSEVEAACPPDQKMDVDNVEVNLDMDKKTGPAAADDKIIDPYAYLNREEFSSERFKIEVKGLPKYYGYGVSPE
jgi:hypothetical protein